MEELIDVIDEAGNLTGNSKPMTEIHLAGHRHRTAHVWVVNAKGELIIQKRAASKINYPNLWDISAAGHVSAGQSSREAAQRETEEEIGLVLPAEKFELLFTIPRSQILNSGTYIDNELTDVYLVRLDFDLAELIIQKEEVAEVSAINFKELEKKILSGRHEFVPQQGEHERLFAELHRRFG